MRQTSLSEAIPRPVSAEISRLHLLPLMETETPVVVLVAPSGYGKTTLLAQYARSAPRTTLWLELGEDDREPRWLANQLTQAVEEREQLTWTWKQNAEAKPEVLGRALARDFSSCAENFNFVLDRIELLNLEAGAFVTAFAFALTEGHRLFLSGYSTESLRLAQLVAYGRATVLLTEDLEFRIVESLNYLQVRGYKGNVQEAVTRLAGWPAGLSLIAIGARPGLSPNNLVLEALHMLPESISNHISKLAVLPVWSEQKATQLGCQLPNGWIEIIRRSGLPLSPLRDGEFVPHQLVLNALEGQLRLHPELHVRLHERAGELALQEGLALKAIKHFATAGKLSRVQTALQPVVEALLWRGEYRAANELFEQVEMDEISVLPGMRAMVYLGLGNTALAEQTARVAINSTPNDAWSFYVLARIAARRGDYAKQLDWAVRGLKIMEDKRGAFFRLRRMQVGALLVLKRQDEALEIAQADMVMAEKAGNLEDIAEAARHVHIALNLSNGDPQQNRYHLERSLEAFRTLGAPIRALPLENNLADLLIQAGDLNGAEIVISHALKIAEDTDSEMLTFLFELSGDICRRRKDLDGARLAYAEARRHSERFQLQVLLARISLSEADMLSEWGLNDEATLSLERAVSLGATNMANLSDQLLFTQGCCAFDLGGWEEAKLNFEKVVKSTNYGIVNRAQRLLVAIQQRLMVTTIGNKPKASSKSLSILNDIDSETTLDYYRLEARSPQNIADTGNYHRFELSKANTLKIKTFGDFDLWCSHQIVKITLSKSQELLVYLALHGPCVRDVLIDIMWDGAPTHSRLEYFKVAVRRLRADLIYALPTVTNPVLFDGRRYRLAQEIILDFDVERLRSARISNDLDLLRAAVKDSGRFLPNVESEWVINLRPQFATQHVEIYERFAHQLSADGQVLEAMQIYRQTLEIEPTCVGGLLGLVKLYLNDSDLAGAIRTVQHQRSVLRAEYNLDIEPHLLAELYRLNVVL
jgi:LuxR family transcriptional regulator, maltose regulon positive regulatory protein